jgi:DNA-binding NtrC family response regulator
MHYLAALSHKLVTAYQNQEDILNSTSRRSDKLDTRLLAEAVQAVLEQEIENGRLRYDLLHVQNEGARLSEQPEPFFAEILFNPR